MRTVPAPPPHDAVVLVTGAASGIGAAVARLAVAAGCRVVLADVDVPGVKHLAGELGSRARAVALDIRDPHAWQQAFDQAEAEFGPVDVLVNNAGIIHTGHARTLTAAQHRDVVEVNLLGTVNGVLAGLERMRARGRGHIVDVCSMTSFLPLTGYATYGATKHAIRAFHHSVALEERNGPVTFSIVHPPSTRTPMLEQEKADPTAVIAFAEKSHSAESVARVVVEAFWNRPVEVVFPPVAGRFQRVVGSWAWLMRVAIPRVEAAGRRNRARTARRAS